LTPLTSPDKGARDQTRFRLDSTRTIRFIDSRVRVCIYVCILVSAILPNNVSLPLPLSLSLSLSLVCVSRLIVGSRDLQHISAERAFDIRPRRKSSLTRRSFRSHLLPYRRSFERDNGAKLIPHSIMNNFCDTRRAAA